MRKLCRALPVVLLAILAFADSAIGIDYFWSPPAGTPGDYNVAANWVDSAGNSYPSPPTTGDYMHVNNGGTCQITSDITLNYPSYVYAGRNPENSGYIEQSGGIANIDGGLRVGYASATGTYTMTGGTLNCLSVPTGTGIFVGSNEGGNGTMTLSGGATVSSTKAFALSGGTLGSSGTLKMYGETTNLTVGGTMIVGQGVADPAAGNQLYADGLMEMHDSTTFLGNGSVEIGLWNFGRGTVRLYDNSKFTVASGMALILGDSNDGAGTYLNPGPGGKGTMTVNDNATVTAGSGLYIGQFNYGFGNMTIGSSSTKTATVDVAGDTQLGRAGGSGTLTLAAGGVLKTNGVALGTSAWFSPFWKGTGSIKFNGGTLTAKVDNATFLADGGGLWGLAIVQSGGAIIDTNNCDVVASQSLLADPSSPGGGLTKIGEGILTLGGASTYTGPTAVSAGALSVTGSITSNVSVADGAALMGTGAVYGDASIAGGGGGGGGRIAPGESIGTLTVNGNVTVSGTLDVEYDSSTQAIDLLAVSGNLDLTGATISFADLGTGSLNQPAYVFATYGSLTGAPAIETGLPAGGWVDYAYGGNSIALLVPEPSLLVLLVGLAMVTAARRAVR